MSTLSSDYAAFLQNKTQLGGQSGFAPVFMPAQLKDFQAFLVEWAVRKGRGLLLEDCGLGKTFQYLVWAQNTVMKTNKRVLVITPLAVSAQTVAEGEKFGIDCRRSVDGKNLHDITVTNYERLHYFDPADFIGVVCDESSAIKNFEGERQKIVTEFMRHLPYRLLCTATAAPNDYIELGTSAEALGELGRMDMLSMFFKNDENSNHPIWWGARWRFKKHAETDFWRWVCSWSRAVRKPSDIGFDDAEFVLPELIVRETVVKNDRPFDGQLFPIAASTLAEQRAERRVTLTARCEEVARIMDHDDFGVMWCHLNAEGDLLEHLVSGAKQISGAMRDEDKEELFTAFSSGQLKKLVIKPKIGAFGLNWQHCNQSTTFPSHSFEQYYQTVRRFWRFGQTRPVTMHIVTTEGELGVKANMQRKALAAEVMFSKLVALMNDALKLERTSIREMPMELPEWL